MATILTREGFLSAEAAVMVTRASQVLLRLNG